MKQHISSYNIAMKAAMMLVLAIFIHTDADAQKQRRHARKHDQLHERIDRLEDNNSMTTDQKKKIDKREKKLHRTERRSVRDGVITPEEQRHINRKYRKTNRAVKQVEKGK
jgi:protein subunit release factor B